MRIRKKKWAAPELSECPFYTKEPDKYKPMLLESEDIKVEEPIKKEPVKEEVNPTIDDTLFEYICDKSGMYKIYLHEGEKLVIKD